MTLQSAPPQLAMKPEYSPREFGGRLNPPRSGQWVLVRIWNREIEATKTGSGWRLSHQELRRFSGQDLTIPGHEEVESQRDDKLRELRVCIAAIDVKLARVHQLVAELDRG